MMTSSYKLTDVFPDWLTGGGIFALLEAQVNPPWVDAINGASLDVEYFGNRSGSKPCAPLIYKLVEDGSLSDENREKLVTAIWNRYGKNWTGLYQTIIAEYNPLENYNMKELSKLSDTVVNEYGKTNTLKNSREATNTTTLALDTTNEGAYSGFNTTTPLPTDSNKSNSDSHGTGKDTSTESTTSTDGGTDQMKKNIMGEVQRSGNIGVTTSQQLLQSERELWLWNFADSMFSDVDTMLTLAVFDHSESINIVKTVSSYELPIASPSVLGGVMPTAKTVAMTQAVGVDGVGRLWVQVPETEQYNLPIASPTVLGGVKPTSKTAAMLQEVGVDGDGRLWTEQSTPALLDAIVRFNDEGDGLIITTSFTDDDVFITSVGEGDQGLFAAFEFFSPPKICHAHVLAGSLIPLSEGEDAIWPLTINRYIHNTFFDSMPLIAYPEKLYGLSEWLSYSTDTIQFDKYELTTYGIASGAISEILSQGTNTFAHLTFYL